MPHPLQIAVLAPGACTEEIEQRAAEVGRLLARAGATLVCGGQGGAMAAAARGARDGGGLTVGILPGSGAESSTPNPHLAVRVHTGLGQGRNLSVVLSADAAIAIGGGWGTLSEIALARRHGVPLVLLDSWQLASPDGQLDEGLLTAGTAAEAVALALAHAEPRV